MKKVETNPETLRVEEGEGGTSKVPACFIRGAVETALRGPNSPYGYEELEEVRVALEESLEKVKRAQESRRLVVVE